MRPLRLVDRISILNGEKFILHGPAGDLIKIGGKRASLQALNHELNAIDGVMDGVFYLPATSFDRLAAFAVAPGLSVSEILGQLRKRIDPVFLPRPLRLVDALPRNITGKLPLDSFRAFVARASDIITHEE
jgi:acyl-coenzyme A synthetase/AMP-(fatty) acid ligase